MLGAVAGGACLGLCLAVLAAGVGAAGASGTTLVTIACVAAAVAAAADVRLAGFRLPFHRRQVNEQWLDQFRPWVYGAGFGWQIGTGLVTYIKTSAVYLMIVLAALTADPLLALSSGCSSVSCAASPCSSGAASPPRPPSPRSIGASPKPGRSWPRVVVAVDVAAAVVLAALVSPWVALVLAASAGAVAWKALRSRRPTRPGGSRSARTA